MLHAQRNPYIYDIRFRLPRKLIGQYVTMGPALWLFLPQQVFFVYRVRTSMPPRRILRSTIIVSEDPKPNICKPPRCLPCFSPIDYHD